MPSFMKAIKISSAGGPQVLVLADRPRPEPQPGELLIRVAAAGVNRPDVLQRLGKYPPPAGITDIPGLEVSGYVVGGDLQDSGFEDGDAVCCLVAGGGYAEYVAVPAAQCLPVPPGLSMVQAAGLPETFFTVWSNLFERAHLKAGESVLIHGGASGIGTTAIQLAKAFQCRVFATVGSDARALEVEKLGADCAINYKTPDFAQIIAERTAGKGVDCILDMVAGSYLQRNLDSLADDGRLVIIAALGGTVTQVDLAKIYQRRLTVTGSTLRARPVHVKADIAVQLREQVWPLLANKTVEPVIHTTFALKDAPLAHALMDSGAHIGKIVLTVDRSPPTTSK